MITINSLEKSIQMPEHLIVMVTVLIEHDKAVPGLTGKYYP